ncbi:hypothetical protein ACFWJI_14620, partial [Streptomyces griseorubiginosus]
ARGRGGARGGGGRGGGGRGGGPPPPPPPARGGPPPPRGAFAPMTTVQRSTSSQRAVTGSDVLITAVLTRPGRRMALADITLTDSASGDLAARAGTVHAPMG